MATNTTKPDTAGAPTKLLDYSSCATVSLAEAARVLGVHRSTAWELYKRGDFPLPVLQVGSRLRVAKVHLESFLLNGSVDS